MKEPSTQQWSRYWRAMPLGVAEHTEHPSLGLRCMKRFITGFAIGLVGFAVANVLAHFYYPYSSSVDVAALVQYYGFPFVVWTSSGFNPQPLSGFALCADTVIALVLSTIGGLFWMKHVSFGVKGPARK
jgi:hypothetical protein